MNEGSCGVPSHQEHRGELPLGLTPSLPPRTESNSSLDLEGLLNPHQATVCLVLRIWALKNRGLNCPRHSASHLLWVGLAALPSLYHQQLFAGMVALALELVEPLHEPRGPWEVDP